MRNTNYTNKIVVPYQIKLLHPTLQKIHKY